jgi:hypothetical protein
MWDGGYYLFRILDDGHAFVVYNRYAVAPLHIPTLVIGRLSGSVELAGCVFSATYALLPLMAAALAWRWHRRDRRAFLWSIRLVTNCTSAPRKVLGTR